MLSSEKKSVASTPSTASEVVDEPKKYTEAELSAMTIQNITDLATNLGYTITKTKKSEIVEEFLSQQNSSSGN